MTGVVIRDRSDHFDGQLHVVCPCGSAYVRPVNSSCHGADGALVPSMTFQCEDGHSFPVSFVFHEGFTLVEVGQVIDLPEPEPEPDDAVEPAAPRRIVIAAPLPRGAIGPLIELSPPFEIIAALEAGEPRQGDIWVGADISQAEAEAMEVEICEATLDGLRALARRLSNVPEPARRPPPPSPPMPDPKRPARRPGSPLRAVVVSVAGILALLALLAGLGVYLCSCVPPGCPPGSCDDRTGACR